MGDSPTINHLISTEGRDSQSLHDSGIVRSQAPGGLKSDSEETLPEILKVMSRDIRPSLLSMLATLKLLNRGYYGNMDEEVAHQTKALFSSATRLIGIVDACLGSAFAMKEEAETVAPKSTGVE